MNDSADNTNASDPDPAHLLPPTKPRLWVRLVLWLIIFGSGMIVGAGMSLAVIRGVALQRIHHPEKTAAVMAARLRRPLQLSDQQVAQVEQVLRQRQRSLEDLRRRVQPEFEAELDLIRQQIGDVLTDKQRERWHQHFDRMRRTWVPALPAAAQDTVTPNDDKDTQ
jgi:hypothetical protein